MGTCSPSGSLTRFRAFARPRWPGLPSTGATRRLGRRTSGALQPRLERGRSRGDHAVPVTVDRRGTAGPRSPRPGRDGGLRHAVERPGLRQEHPVDDVDGRVLGLHVAADDLGRPVHREVLTAAGDLDRPALERLVRARELVRRQPARHDVVREHGRQEALRVGQRRIEGRLVERGEGVVRRREHGEVVGRVERLAEAGGADRGDERRERLVVRSRRRDRVEGHPLGSCRRRWPAWRRRPRRTARPSSRRWVPSTRAPSTRAPSTQAPSTRRPSTRAPSTGPRSRSSRRPTNRRRARRRPLRGARRCGRSCASRSCGISLVQVGAVQPPGQPAWGGGCAPTAPRPARQGRRGYGHEAAHAVMRRVRADGSLPGGSMR